MVRTVPREQKRYRLHLAHLPDTAVSIVLLAFDSGQRKSAHEYAPGGGVRAADRADLGTLLRRYMRTGGDQHRPEAPQIPQDQAAGIGPGEGLPESPFP